MIEPLLPADESARLLSLHSLRILDTLPEERFDRVTRMGRRWFGSQICLVSLVDSSRQWFKSKQGLDACETSREISFCGHAIHAPDVFVVENAVDDDRFHDNPLVTGAPNIRFYAGCPLTVPGGHRIGTLCVIDSNPRSFTDEDGDMLRDLAAIVEGELRSTAEATVDSITGIANRRGFEAVAQHVLPLCQRTGTSAELAFFDLDNMKVVNDRMGHASGDEMLAHFAKLLLRSFRSADVVARLGGDEFAVLLTASDPDSSAPFDRLLASAAEEPCCVGDLLEWSYGRVPFDPSADDQTIAAVMAEADAEMYRQKQAKKASRGTPSSAA